MVNKFFHSEPLLTPESVRPFLAEAGHWREQRSAYELAHSWIGAGDIPGRVRAVLDTCPIFQGATLVEGLFEHQTDLRSAGHPSQTDLLTVLRLAAGGYAVIAVEGKAGEAFGPIIREWKDSHGKEERLRTLCSYLGLNHDSVFDLRYQLLHRTAAALFEAERYAADQAMTMIYSFSSPDGALEDYRSFVRVLGIQPAGPDQVTEARKFHGIELRFAWVSDRPVSKGKNAVSQHG